MFKAFFVGLLERLWLSYKSTLLGIVVAAAAELLTYAATAGNVPPYVHIIVGVLLTPFLAWKDKAVANGTIKLLVLFALLLPAMARAQSAPADEPPLVISSCPTTAFGGPVGKWMCFAPAVSLSVMDFNVTTGKFEAALNTGAGYGFSVHQNDWWGFSLHAYVNINPALASGSASLIVTILNGYVGIGASKGMFNDHDWRIPLTAHLSF